MLNLFKIDCLCEGGQVKLIFTFFDGTFSSEVNLASLAQMAMGWLGYPRNN